VKTSRRTLESEILVVLFWGWFFELFMQRNNNAIKKIKIEEEMSEKNQGAANRQRKQPDGPPPVHLLNPGPAHPPADSFQKHTQIFLQKVHVENFFQNKNTKTKSTK
jgi:hypothetical protein